uniref:Uncharacterized protein n=1 Tax=viral metagenome TaxID=1070528 RepID=A0A6C0C594_9ZZZZ
MGLSSVEKQLRAEEKKIRLGKVSPEDIEHAKKRIIVLKNIIEAEKVKNLEFLKKKEEAMLVSKMTSEEMLDQEYDLNSGINAENIKNEKKQIRNRKKYLKRRAANRFCQIVKKKYNLKKNNFIKNHKLFTIIDIVYNQSSISVK